VPTASEGDFAGITSGRVLNAKHSTANRAGTQPSRVWDRVAQAASSSRTMLSPPAAAAPAARLPERFPPLHPAVPSTVAPRGNAQQRTPWTGNTPAASTSNTPRPYSVPGPAAVSSKRPGGGAKKGPDLSKNAFPGLPTSTNIRQKPPVSGNISLKNIVGSTTPTVQAWGAGGSGSGLNTPSDAVDAGTGGADANVADSATPGGLTKGKKGKGKQKQTLFTLGSFPA
jgi:E3 ubiquitin-protein ligase ZNF598